MSDIDVVAIGNAIVDVIAQVDDNFLRIHDIQKGSMTLVDQQQADNLYESMPPTTEKSGGSAANTIAGIVSLGGSAAFIGKIKDDQLGKIFTHDLRALGVHYQTPAQSGGLNTASCMVMVTPDAQRSMATYLGATKEISPSDVDEDVVANAKVTYLEGYLWDEQHAKEAMRRAVEIANKHGNEIALSLSDSFCVTRHKEEFLELITNNVDILFANESEIYELLSVSNIEDAAEKLKSICKVTAVTLGAKGSIIVAKDQQYNIEAGKNLNVIDTTGAGDLYASGFLFGYTSGKDLQECGRIATISASEVIQHIGARPEVTLADLV